MSWRCSAGNRHPDEVLHCGCAIEVGPDPRDHALRLAEKALEAAFRAQREVVNEFGSGFDEATLRTMHDALTAIREALK